ncbi:MAG: hypothetical protein AAF661_05125 [Pseudomonadota bacterium]
MSDYENPPKGFEMAGWDNDALRAREATEADIETLMSENARLRVALEWYEAQARRCRLIHSEGDGGRHALQADGGTIARKALAVSAPAPADDTAKLQYERDQACAEVDRLGVGIQEDAATIARQREALRQIIDVNATATNLAAADKAASQMSKIAEDALAAESATPAPPWRYDVESAPKDGTEFDALLNDGRVIVYFYLDNSDKPYPWAGFRPRYGAEKPGQKMIAWMPRPVAPEKEGATNE